ncbi:centrosomal protein of 164 kDa [Drosophila kikkawai]|uniref:Centrosomal protein of 164 kDa n=1 Tax=Drosophila kikkawai TaxID=30033 RepID=A0A6P4JLF9_DROKI|nr:centrosomal protein of 164 kDa [Drosophila kikkawai]
MTTTSVCRRISSATASLPLEAKEAGMTKAASTTKCLEYSSPATSVICEEVFDEACFPSQEEINDYATLIGIEPQGEQHLLYLAKEGLMAALPSDWKICYSEEKNGHYYHNTRTKESQWDHPLDAIYRGLVEQTRQKLAAEGGALPPCIDNSDDLSLLDSGIRSMQGIDEIPSPSPLPSPLGNLGKQLSLAKLVPAATNATTPRKLGGVSSRFLDLAKSRVQSGSGGGGLFKKTTESSSLSKKLEYFEGNAESLGKLRKGFGPVSYQKAATGRPFDFDGDVAVAPASVKGILRDSSITDINRRLEGRDDPISDISEDKKSVRFNLQEISQAQQSAQDSPEEEEEDNVDLDVVVVKDQDEEEEGDDWNENGTDSPVIESMPYSLNPFLCDSILRSSKDFPPGEASKMKGAGSALYHDDTDSDSKGSSVRSFIINKSEQGSLQLPENKTFDLDELGRKHSYELEQLQLKSTQDSASVAVGESPQKFTEHSLSDGQAQKDLETIKREHEAKVKALRHEYDLRLTSHQHQLEESFELQLEEYREHLESELLDKRALVVTEHKSRMATLQSNHDEILRELERDLHSEEEIVRREHAARLAQVQAKLSRELDIEKQRFRDKGEDRLYEKVRCEKRLLEDKYRCLKEKYVRLKTDVKLSLERRNRRREAQLAISQHNTKSTTGSETERSISYKPSIGNSDNRSLSYSEHAVAGEAKGKPPVPPKGQLAKPSIATKYIKQLQQQQRHDDNTSISQSDTTISNTFNNGGYHRPTLKSASGGGGGGGGGGLLAITLLSDNGNSTGEEPTPQSSNQENNNNSNSSRIKETAATATAGLRNVVFSRTKSASTSRLNSDTSYNKVERPCTPVENLRHQLQKLEDLEDQFPEHTLDATATYHLRYPFTDISIEHDVMGVGSSELEFFKHRIHLERDSVRRAKESLRTQRTNFRLRQRELRQRHKATTTTVTPKHSLGQLIQDEKELTEMEVNLHRTRSLLGEKVIRLRHLEQSLLRIYDKESNPEAKDDSATLSDLSSHSSSGFSSTDFASAAGGDLHKRKEFYFQQESNECIQNLEILNAEIREILDIFGQKQQQHHSLQFQQSVAALPMVSPPIVTDLNWTHMLNKQQQQQQQHSSIMASVEQQLQTNSSSMQNCQIAVDDVAGGLALAHAHVPHSIPTLADRLETYRQLAAGRMQSSMGGAILTANTIVSQNPRAVNYTTSLVERTRDLRNWLRQAKNEHDLLVGGLGGSSVGGATIISSASTSAINTVAGGAGAGGVGGSSDEKKHI